MKSPCATSCKRITVNVAISCRPTVSEIRGCKVRKSWNFPTPVGFNDFFRALNDESNVNMTLHVSFANPICVLSFSPVLVFAVCVC